MFLALHPDHDSPGKKDATGAFRPEARAFDRLHTARGAPVTTVPIDNRRGKGAMRQETLDAIRCHGSPAPLGCFAFFCHGLRRSLQFGLAEPDIAEFAASIVRHGTPDVRVVLYSCDVARDADREQEDDLQPGPGGEGGFADLLADAIRAAAPGWSGWVDGHTIAGHTTKNRYVRRFRGAADGGAWIVEPGSKLWRRWGDAIRGRVPSDLRLRFPLMTDDEIRAELGA